MMPEINPFWINKYEVARGFRGQRHELRKCFESAKGPLGRQFFSSVLKAHTELMYQNLSPIRSYLWKAEKDGNLVHLFGDMHMIFQGQEGFSKFINPQGFFDASAYCSSFIHPTVLSAFEKSDKLYVEIFRFKYLDELLELHNEINNQTVIDNGTTSEESSSEEDSDYEGTFSLSHSTYCQLEDVAELIESNYKYDSGLVDRLMVIKAGGIIDGQEIVKKIDSFVVEMETMKIQKDAIKRSQDNVVEGTDNEYLDHLDMLDAVQMGNLKYMEDLPSHIWIDDRNPRMVDWIIKALVSKENAFVTAGFLHFVGEKGIVNLLEKQGVIVTRIDLD